MGTEKEGMRRNPALYREMNIGEILIWESSNLLLLIPVVIGLVMLVRWFQGRPCSRSGIGYFFLATRVTKLCRRGYGPFRRLALGRDGNWLRPRSLRSLRGGVSACANIVAPKPIAPSPSQKIYRGRNHPSSICPYIASQAPHSAR
jgi:hypothetical protein